MSGDAIDILTYHSISDGPGPICIAPETFRQQMDAMAACGYRGAALCEVVAWLRGGDRLPGKSLVLTFDDGYSDFADVVLPELRARGWTATVFVPAGKLGGTADWDARRGRPARRLLSTSMVKELAGLGVEVAAHGISHTDLTTLAPDEVRKEIGGAQRHLEDCIGRRVTSFAAPYGRTNPAVQAEIRQHYQAAVGTTLAQARPTSDLYDLPRIEMWYFRHPGFWRSHLMGGGRGYLLLRRMLRRARVLGRRGFS
jgi:peptidoglycan/xylan/chitin deacetylase (PgdA/CDA1 family)